MHRFANPARFTRLADAILPWSLLATLGLLGAGLYLGLFASPADYQQGESYRIIFIHVPAAWMSLFVYVVMAFCGAVIIVWRMKLAEVVLISSAPIGASFTFLALATGSLWGKPMWGTYWVWDARLTSVLVLFFLYLGLIALWQAIDEPSRAGRAAAILALVGFVNVPIIKFSVDWWNTLHQPASLTRLDAPAIDPAMLWPLLAMGIGYMTFFLTLLLLRMKSELLAARLRALSLQGAAGG